MTNDAIDIEAVLKSGRPRRGVWRIVAIVSAVAVLAAGAWYVWGSGGASRSGTTYTTDAATVTDLRILVTATGTVEPTNQVELSSELSGTMGEVLVDYNDAVVEGQVLARLKADQLEASVKLSRAMLAVQQAEVLQAEATVAERQAIFKRSQELLDKNFTSTENYEIAKADSDRSVAALSAAKANLDNAAANLDIAEFNLEKASIRSPINGVVLARDVEPGQIVAVVAVGAGALHAGRGPDRDGAPGRYRRGRRRASQRWRGRHVHGRGLPATGSSRPGSPSSGSRPRRSRASSPTRPSSASTTRTSPSGPG